MISSDEARQRVARDFLALAQRDAAAMRVLSREPTLDFSPIGFHAQQCIEKCLKGVMAKVGITYPRTHDLGELHKLLASGGHAMPLSLETMADFTPYAVTTRYDIDQDDLINRVQSENAVALVLAWADSTINPN
jgi:hypothetical protein